MADMEKHKGGDAGALSDEQFGNSDPNAGIPASSAGGGLVEPGKTDIGSAPLGTGGAHADRSIERDISGGPHAIDYNEDEGQSERRD